MALSANELDLVVAKACQVGSAVMVGRRRKNEQTEKINKQGLCHTVALPFTLKKNYIKAKEELWEFKYFTMQI